MVIMMEEQIFQNEFATVKIKKDETANGVRLYICDMMTGTGIYLDPLELEALTRATHKHFIPFVNSSKQ
jgi:hypothetical protein